MTDKASILKRLEQCRTRLDAYYTREAEMLSRDGVKSYGIGSRNLTRYDTGLKDIQEAVRQLQNEIAELEMLLMNGHSRRAAGVIPRDW